MCDALVWSDERNPSLTSELIIALRQIWHFRTLCILNNERTENAVVAQCRMLFPNWIGFLPERWIQTPGALAEYRRGDASLRLCLHSIDIDDKEEEEEEVSMGYPPCSFACWKRKYDSFLDLDSHTILLLQLFEMGDMMWGVLGALY